MDACAVVYHSTAALDVKVECVDGPYGVGDSADLNVNGGDVVAKTTCADDSYGWLMLMWSNRTIKKAQASAAVSSAAEAVLRALAIRRERIVVLQVASYTAEIAPAILDLSLVSSPSTA